MEPIWHGSGPVHAPLGPVHASLGAALMAARYGGLRLTEKRS